MASRVAMITAAGEARAKVSELMSCFAGLWINVPHGRPQGERKGSCCESFGHDSMDSSSGTLLRAASDEIFKIFFSGQIRSSRD
jgi:hypothetical protein